MGAETQAEIQENGFEGWLTLWTMGDGDLWRLRPPVPVVLGEKSPVAPPDLLMTSAAVDSRLWAKFPSLPSWNFFHLRTR